MADNCSSSAMLATHPARLVAANWARTCGCLALLTVVAIGLTLIFGRTGERIAVQLCVNVAAVVALGLFAAIPASFRSGMRHSWLSAPTCRVF